MAAKGDEERRPSTEMAKDAESKAQTSSEEDATTLTSKGEQIEPDNKPEAGEAADARPASDLPSNDPEKSEPAPAAAPTPPQTPPIPNGGLVAWCQVLGSFFLNFNSWGIALSYGVYQTYYTPLLAASPSSISWIGSIQIFLLVAVGVVTGPLYDMGYFRPLIFTGSFLVVFGMMMTSLATEYWQLVLAQGLVVGLGTGCLFVPGVSILPTYFSTRRALAQGLASTGSSLGGVIYPIVFRQLQPHVGFGWATRVIAFLAIVTLAFPLAAMRMRMRPPARRAMFDAGAWREPAYALFSIGLFFGFLSIYIPYVYLQTYAVQETGTGANIGFYLLAIVNAGSIFGRVVPNFFADRTGPLNMMLPTSAATTVLLFAWIGISSQNGLVAFAALFGFFSGTFVSLPPVTVVTLSPHLGVVGVRLGMAFFFVSLGLLLGAPIGGAILSHGWPGLQAWGGACCAISVACMAAARVSKGGWAFRSKA